MVNPNTGANIVTYPNENIHTRVIPSTGDNPSTGIAYGNTAENPSSGVNPSTGVVNSSFASTGNNLSTEVNQGVVKNISTDVNPSTGASSNTGDYQKVSPSNNIEDLLSQSKEAGDFIINDRGQIVIDKRTAKWITTMKIKEKGVPSLQFGKVWPGNEHPI